MTHHTTDEQRAKFDAHEKAQFKIWAEGKFKHIAEHMRWVTISIAEEGWMARAALAAQEGGGERVTERWEPMETAPMDGTVIQFLQGGEVFAGFAGDDPDHPWQFLDRNGRQAFVNGFHHKFSPRWWRPLAEAPKEAALRAAQEGGAVQWACERWRAEVANRPLVNTHRRALDTTWRQVVRHFGGDDVALLGPCHDDLVSAQEGTSNDR